MCKKQYRRKEEFKFGKKEYKVFKKGRKQKKIRRKMEVSEQFNNKYKNIIECWVKSN